MYHPAPPSVPRNITKGYRVMVKSYPRLEEVVKEPPMVAYTRPPDLLEKLIVIKVPPPPGPNTRPECESKGMRECNNCSALSRRAAWSGSL